MGKTVLLFSGGMDSYAIAHLTQPDILLYCNIGLPEQIAEMKAIMNLKLPEKSELIIDDRLYLRDQKLANEIVPMRNLFFTMIGAYYGSHVMLGATAGDTTCDKDYTFADKTNDVLRYIFSNQHKNPKTIMGAGGFTLSLPYKDKTKSQIALSYIQKGHSVRNLVNTRSCYADEELECGVCRSCVRKFAALGYCGIDISAHFKMNPRYVMLREIEEAKKKGRGAEAEEMRKTWGHLAAVNGTNIDYENM